MRGRAVLQRAPRLVAVSAVCILGAWLAAVQLIRSACSAMPLNYFDGVLQLLIHVYAAKGLTMYRDFGSAYAPGSPALYGTFLGLSGVNQLNFAWASTIFLITVVNMRLLWRIPTSMLGRWALCGGYLVWTGVVIEKSAELATDVLAPHLAAGLMILAARAFDRDRLCRTHALIACLFSAAIALQRWDRLPCLVLIQAGMAVLMWLLGIARVNPTAKEQFRLRAIRSLVMIEVLGALSAYSLWLLEAWWQGTLDNALMFVFRLHAIMRPYRALPLPACTELSKPNGLLSCSLLALAGAAAVCCVAAAWDQRAPYLQSVARRLWLLALPLAVLPYSLGRADSYHFGPILAMVGVALLLCSAVAGGGWERGGLLVLLVVFPLFPLKLWQRPMARVRLAECGGQVRQIDALIADCRGKLPAGARSIFVGRNSYARYIYNEVVLYWTNLALVPATPFISDEPGIQNSCEFGERIAADLEAAPKPMVVLLQASVQEPEPNATRTMTSCGRIEEFLEKTPFRPLGGCLLGGAGGMPVELRLYP